jgi:enamine deaminase RidA (YjgF/YER057c/UK114 family)
MPAEIERHVSPDLFPPPGYSHAVVSPPGAVVWTAGGVPLDVEGRLVGAGDLTAQTEQVLANLTLALETAGATPRDVVRTTVYVVTEARGDLGVVWDAVQASGFAPRGLDAARSRAARLRRAARGDRGDGRAGRVGALWRSVRSLAALPGARRLLGDGRVSAGERALRGRGARNGG